MDQQRLLSAHQAFSGAISKSILDSLNHLAHAYLFAGYVEEAVTTLEHGIQVIETDEIDQMDKFDHAKLLLAPVLLDLRQAVCQGLPFIILSTKSINQ